MTHETHSLPPASAPAGPSMTLADVLYILFRHKLKIVLCAILGIVAAFVVRMHIPRLYQSEAKLYISYVLETHAPTTVGENLSASAGESAINTELEILRSRDLAQQVADDIGPEKLLGAPDVPDARIAAATLIQKSLVAEVVPKANVIRLAFQHTDPKIVQPVLTRLTSFYFVKHNELRTPEAVDEFLKKETESLRSRLETTEEQLKAAKAKAGIVALDDDKKAFTDQIRRIQSSILEAEAELASRQAELSVIASPAEIVPTNAPQMTNTVASSVSATNLTVPPETLRKYRALSTLLENLRAKEQQLLVQFTPESLLVTNITAQISADEKIKRQFEEDYPGLVAVQPLIAHSAMGEPAATQHTDVIAAKAGAAALQAKIQKLNEQLTALTSKAGAVEQAEDSILDLQRKKEFNETYYKHFLEKLAQAQLDKKASAEQVSIRPVQLPSPPMRAPSKRMKMTLGAAFGGVAFGLALAFLFELYLDPSVRRPIDIQSRLPFPLFITIPTMKLNGNSGRKLPSKKIPLLPFRAGTGNSVKELPHTPGGPNGNSHGSELLPAVSKEAAPWAPGHLMRPFSDGLRDRLMTWFELKNMTHKPKLVSITSCHDGSGVSTIAAGLAASLSETGEGNVLLVDMNTDGGAAHYFHKGDLACDIDDALQTKTREEALIQEKLYLVNESKLPTVLPTRFKNLVPRLKASDFDYIIFDMPPISQISVTPRLAKFMDIVLVVAESETTGKEVLRKATSFLAEAKANVGLVLNKTRAYVPRKLQHEL